MTIRALLLPAVFATSVLLCACGGASSANSAVLNVASDVSAAAANPVTVSPLPGTADASSATQISFLGGPGTHVVDVHGAGSRSGMHSGVLRAYSTGTGESFLPAHPFLTGERVTVHAHVVVAGVTEVATPTCPTAHQAPGSQKQFPINAGNPAAVQHYASAPALTPSTVSITTPARAGAAPGDLFLAPYQGGG